LTLNAKKGNKMAKAILILMALMVIAWSMVLATLY